MFLQELYQLDEFGESHKEKIEATMQKAGYKKLGSGADASVYAKDAGTVIKILMPETGKMAAAERTFLEFYNFVQKLQGVPNLPRFYKIQGQHYAKFNIDGEEFYQIAMEQLYPIKEGSLEEGMVWQLADYAVKNISWENVYRELQDPEQWKAWHDPDKFVNAVRNFTDKQKHDYAYLFTLMQLLYRTGQAKKLFWDLHTANMMQRADGTLVVVDPWYVDVLGSV